MNCRSYVLLVLIFLQTLSCTGKSQSNSSFQSLESLRKKAHKNQVICLNMIVKNESAVIRRCLDSVKDIIDYWVIVDTGSRDKTQDIIRAHMQGIPGELHERPWKNWGETRTEAFELAKGKGDYILFMDADDVLEFAPGYKLPKFTEDVLFMWRGNRAYSYLKQQLVRGDLPWKWIGVTHEYLDCDRPYTSHVLEDVRYISLDDGATRSDLNKFWKNVELLKEGLQQEPNNTRYAFYLAESYYDAQDRAKALEAYQKRIDMGGWVPEEIFWSKFRIAYIMKLLGLADSIVIEGYKDAIAYRPHRPEPYYYAAEILHERKDYEAAYEMIQAYFQVKQPVVRDYLFNADWIREYGMLFQLSLCSYYLGYYQESLDACDQLLANEELPKEWRALVSSNRQFCVDKVE